MYFYAALGKELRWFGDSVTFASLMVLKQCIFPGNCSWAVIDVAYVAICWTICTVVQEYICTDTWMDDTTSPSMWPVTTVDSCRSDFWAVQFTAKGGVNGYIPLGVPCIASFDFEKPERHFPREERVLLRARCFCLDCWQFGRIWSFLGPLEKFADIGSLDKAIR